MPPPSPVLDEFEQAEEDARRNAAAEGFALGQAPPADVLARLAVVE